MVFIIDIISSVIYYYSWALIIYILMSWFPNARSSVVGEFLARICEPYLDPFRRIIPPIGVLDISAIVAIFVLQLANNGLHQLLMWLI